MATFFERWQGYAAQLDQMALAYAQRVLDDLPKPVVFLIAVIAVVGAILFGRQMARGMNPKAPPTFEGIPLIGGILKFAKGPMKVMADGYASFGEVFTVPLLHKNLTFLIGPTVAPHFFKATDDEMSQTEVYKFNVPTFGPGVVFDVDIKIRTEQIRFFTESLKTSKLQSYVPQFVMEAEAYFAKWDDEGVVDLQEKLSELVILTASRTLMGAAAADDMQDSQSCPSASDLSGMAAHDLFTSCREVREQMFDKVASLLHDLDEGMRPLSVIAPHFPTAYHRKRDKARKELSQLFSKVIQARRASGVQEDDVLQVFIDSKYRSVYGGRATTDEEITGFLIATLFAGQHTSSITSSWTGFFMLTNQEATLQPALEEQRRIRAKHGDKLDMEVLSEMEVLHRNIQEALRMHPPLTILMRYCKKPFSVTTSKGLSFVIPKGDIVVTSPGFAATLDKVWKDADKYQPDRFKAPREEDKTPFSYIAFGGGRHGCLGQNFAYLQIKTIWSVILRNFELEMVDPMPEANYDGMVVGPKPCRVRYRRRKLI